MIEIKKTKTMGGDLSALMFSKLPPQARDAEDVILGSILIDRDAFGRVSTILKSRQFYDDRNLLTYEACEKLFNESKPIDIITVVDRLKADGNLESIGGPYRLTELSNRVGSSANIEAYAHIIVEKYIMREIIRVCSLGIEMGYEDTDDPFDTLNRLLRDLEECNSILSVGKIRSVGQVTEIVMREAIEARDSADHLSGLPSGLFDLDMLTKGFKAPQLVIIAARPAMGKTALMMNIGRNYANEGPVGIFSLEMSAEELTRRLISMQTGIETHKIETGQFENIDHSIAKVAGLPIYINDTAGLNTQEIQVSARKMVSQYGCKALFVDYIQLMHGAGKYGNRETEVSEISRTLKRVAKTLKVPVIALSQLSRKCEERGNKRPMLSDLRESGAIEQDADIVIFMYRPEYYGEMQSEHGESLAGVTELIVAKQRSGPTGTVFCHFNKVTTSFGKHESDFEPF